jgi:hypothetical protein
MHANAGRANEGRITRKLSPQGVAGVHRSQSAMTAM